MLGHHRRRRRRRRRESAIPLPPYVRVRARYKPLLRFFHSPSPCPFFLPCGTREHVHIRLHLPLDDELDYKTPARGNDFQPSYLLFVSRRGSSFSAGGKEASAFLP